MMGHREDQSTIPMMIDDTEDSQEFMTLVGGMVIWYSTTTIAENALLCQQVIWNPSLCVKNSALWINSHVWQKNSLHSFYSQVEMNRLAFQHKPKGAHSTCVLTLSHLVLQGENCTWRVLWGLSYNLSIPFKRIPWKTVMCLIQKKEMEIGERCRSSWEKRVEVSHEKK